MATDNDPLLDRGAVRRSFDDAAGSYDGAAVLQREVGKRLLERLELIRLDPARILDLGCGTGEGTAGLRGRYRRARVIGLDIAPAMLRQTRRRGGWLRPVPVVCGDAEALPLCSDSVDMIFSNLVFQWCDDLPRLFAECQRVLRPGGLLMFSTFGPDTLRELRESWAAADDRVHVNRFVDMHDVGDVLVQRRFADPVMDMETLTLTYHRVRDLMSDLKAIGARNTHRHRHRGMTGRGRLAAMEAAYEAFRGADGRLPATWEVVYGHAWAAEHLPQTATPDGAVALPLDAVRRRLRGRR